MRQFVVDGIGLEHDTSPLNKDLADTDEARVEAAKRIGLLLHDHAGKLWADEDWQMDVTDDVGLILFVINVVAMQSSATSGSRSKSDLVK